MTPKQIEALGYLQDNFTTEVFLSGSAGSAKSLIVAFHIIKSCLKYPGFRFGVVRRDMILARQTVVESLNEVLDLQGLPREIMKLDNRTNIIRFDNGSYIQLINGSVSQEDENNKLSRLGSVQLCQVFLEESNGISKLFFDIIKTRLRYIPDCLKGKPFINKIICVSNPDINSWLYSYFWKPFENRRLPGHIKVVHSTLEDNPFLPEGYKETMRNLQEPEYSRLYLGKWVSQTDNQVVDPIKLDIALCQPLKNIEYANRISVDVGRKKDATIVVLWHNLTVVKIYRFVDMSIPDQAKEIQKIQASYNISRDKIVIDQDGLGIGLVDLLKAVGISNSNSPINKEHYQNLKTQLYYKFASLIDEVKIHADNATQDQIKAEFGCTESIIRGDAPWKITSKEDIKKKMGGKSPDYADAIVYGMYFESNVKKNGIYNFMGSVGLGQQSATDNSMYRDLL